ncbi:MAG: hypothetical protein CSA75_02015 [Sorangium cellulosum]|nr:MAG: hypothetical protein CSA75_02015 [Sorangium cellulosum]
MKTMTQTDSDQSETKAVPRPGTEVNLALMATGSVGLIAMMVGLLAFDGHAALGVFVGTSLAVANLWVFKQIGHAILSESGSSRAMWVLVGALKFVALLVGVGLLLRYDIVGAVPLIVGYGALPVGITMSNFLVARFEDES